MLVKKFDFKPPMSVEARLIAKLQKTNLEAGKIEFEDNSEEDDELPVVVDPDE